jgi:uncharacterized phage protein (TIGR01671 family)
MREIKFRGKRVDNSGWVYGDLIHDGFDGIRVHEIGISAPGCYSVGVDPETVGEFTGLHDKNGKKVYEGDIVNRYFVSLPYFPVPEKEGKLVFTGVVEWDEDELALRYDKTNMGTYPRRCLEVIGNIYENGDLLK